MIGNSVSSARYVDKVTEGSIRNSQQKIIRDSGISKFMRTGNH